MMAAMLLMIHLLAGHHRLVLALPQLRVLHTAALHVALLLLQLHFGRDSLLSMLLDD